MKSIENNPN